METIEEGVGADDSGDGAAGEEQPVALGRFAHAPAGHVSEEENIEAGTQAMQYAIQHQASVKNAMHRTDVGGISFVWGYEGDAVPLYENEFKKSILRAAMRLFTTGGLKCQKKERNSNQASCMK